MGAYQSKMKFKNYALFVLLIPIMANAQINDLPNIEQFIRFESNTTRPTDSLRADGSPHVIYKQENGKTLREEYHEYGGLKSICEIKQILKQDTFVYVDLDTQQNMIGTEQAWVDKPIGNYEDYHESWVQQRIKSKGRCMNGKKVGEWVFYDIEGNKTIALFDDNGALNGPYQEFYWNSNDDTYTLKIEGQYGVKKYKLFNRNKSGGIYTYNTSEIRRVGSWKYYSKNGRLLEIAEYKWKLDDRSD